MLTRIAHKISHLSRSSKILAPTLAKQFSEQPQKTFTRDELMRNGWRLDYGTEVILKITNFLPKYTLGYTLVT